MPTFSKDFFREEVGSGISKNIEYKNKGKIAQKETTYSLFKSRQNQYNCNSK